MANISKEQFRDISLDMKSYNKKTISELAEAILEKTMEDPSVYTAGGNRARLLIIRGNVLALREKVRKL